MCVCVCTTAASLNRTVQPYTRTWLFLWALLSCCWCAVTGRLPMRWERVLNRSQSNAVTGHSLLWQGLWFIYYISYFIHHMLHIKPPQKISKWMTSNVKTNNGYCPSFPIKHWILQAACFMVTALLHLFFMASFSWMLVEGLLLWSKVVSVNISEDRRMKLYYVIGWGKRSPLIHDLWSRV